MTSIPNWLKPRYPFTPRGFVTPRGARMSYLDEGDGEEAVLMLHGNPTWSFYYSELVQAIASRRRCIVPDHIGMGLSEKPEGYPYTLATRIDDIRALVASLGLKKVHLVVHDWGGAIGFGFARLDPQLIGRVVVMNTAAFPSPRIPARIAWCRRKGLGTFLVRALNGFAGPAVWMAMHRRSLNPVEKRGLLWPYGSWKERVAIDGFVKDIPMDESHPTWRVLNEVAEGIAQFAAHPVLIVWGGRDFCFNDSFYDEWRRRLPQAQTHYMADAGHYVLLDADAEVVPIITEFIDAGS